VVNLNLLFSEFDIDRSMPSYAVLRKWRRENEFKELEIRFREEFSARFVQHMRLHHEETNKRWAENCDREVGKLLNRPDTPEQRQRDLEEVGLHNGSCLYGPELIATIYEKIEPEISGGGTLETFYWLNLLNMLFVSSARKSHDPYRKVHYSLLRCLSIAQLEETKSVLQSPERITSEDRQSAVRLLDPVQRFLEWPPTN